MRDRIGAASSSASQPHPERVELSSSAPTPPFGAPSLGAADRSWGITSARIAQMLADLDPENERIDFPIHAHRAFGEAPEGGAR